MAGSVYLNHLYEPHLKMASCLLWSTRTAGTFKQAVLATLATIAKQQSLSMQFKRAVLVSFAIG